MHLKTFLVWSIWRRFLGTDFKNSILFVTVVIGIQGRAIRKTKKAMTFYYRKNSASYAGICTSVCVCVCMYTLQKLPFHYWPPPSVIPCLLFIFFFGLFGNVSLEAGFK
ncbi:Hypothetical predicted protein [Octopus vulgaris]|uniref:Uncharacterized protein n=1 Tax=Octopus vulgaris TaxID=6645 RepID=A0AA36AZB9_OCTVU|nr:Hypothetical predicted protein [Octopus vulgaris]